METLVPKVRGRILLSRLSYLRRKADMGAFDRVLLRLPAADQGLLRGALDESEGYDLGVNHRLDAAIAAELSPDDPDRVFRDMGRVSAEANLLGSQRAFLTKGDCHRFLSQAPEIYGLYYEIGHRTYEKIGDRAALLRTFNAENVSREDCLTVVGWHERALEMCGGRDVTVEETHCRARGHPFCQYRCAWH